MIPDSAGHYCGCCGGDRTGDDPWWCQRCEGHVLGPWTPSGRYRGMCDRTYAAWRGMDCPHQAGGGDS